MSLFVYIYIYVCTYVHTRALVLQECFKETARKTWVCTLTVLSFQIPPEMVAKCEWMCVLVNMYVYIYVPGT